MKSIASYTYQHGHLYNHPFWKNLTYLSESQPDKVTLVVPNYIQIRWLAEGLLNLNPTQLVLPNIVTFQQWGLQLSNGIKPSRFMLHHIFYNCIEENKERFPQFYICHERCLDALCTFFIQLFFADKPLPTTLFKEPFEPFDNDIRDLYDQFKTQVTMLLGKAEAYDLAKQCGTKKRQLREQLTDQAVFLCGFTQCQKEEQEMFHLLLPYLPHVSICDFSFDSSGWEALFNKSAQLNVQKIPEKKQTEKHPIVVGEFDNIENEVSWIGQMIYERVKKDPAMIVQIICPSNKHWVTQLKKILLSLEITVIDAAPKQFGQTSLYRCLTSMLEFMSFPLDPHALDKLLSTPYIENASVKGKTIQVDLDIIHRVLEQSSEMKTVEALERMFNEIKLELQASLAWIDPKEMPKKEKQIHSIQTQWTIIDELYKIVKTCHQPTNSFTWGECFLELIAFFQLPQIIESLACEAPQLLDEWDCFQDNFPSFCEQLEQIPLPVWKLKFVTKRFQKYFSELTLPEPNDCYHVVLHQLGTIPLIPCEQLIISGFTELNWPVGHRENLFQTMLKYSNLCEKPRLSDEKKQLELLFALLRCSKNSVITWAKKNNDQVTFVSHFLSHIKACFDCHSVKKEETNTAMLMKQARQRAVKEDIAFIELKKKRYLEKNHHQLQKKSLINNFFERLVEHPVSVSQLDLYQKCPYHFYLKNSLELSKSDESLGDVSAASWGILIHEICYHYNETKYALPGYSVAHYEALLRAIADKCFRQVAQDNFFWALKKDILFGDENQKSLCEEMSEGDVEQLFDIQADTFEYPFELNVAGTKIKIKGTLDAIYHTRQHVPVILDYKTGKHSPGAKDIETCRQFQVPLYLWAVSQIKKQVPAGAIITKIHSVDGVESKVIACSQESKKDVFKLSRQRPFIINASYIDRVETVMLQIISLLERGVISFEKVEPLNESFAQRATMCRFCEFKLSCHYQGRFQA